MTQVYFRKPGKKMWLPTMLQADHLPGVLNHREPIEVLDVVALQCDPDSADYIRVSKCEGLTLLFTLFTGTSDSV